MKKLGSYALSADLTNENAGYSVWGFGKKEGKDYFIKQFIEQKYPANDTVSSPERLQKKIRECSRFEARKKAIYHALNQNSDGIAVRVEEFFRIDSKYYISMRKICSLKWSVSDITQLPTGEIRRLCAIIAHGVASLHRGHLIHADLKPDNILFMTTGNGYITAKIIDFDSGFLESDPPAVGDPIVGDFHYFSPEACRHIWGEEAKLTCKMDIFAMGIMFHQFFSGELPGFDMEQNSYSGEAAARGEVLTLSPYLPNDIQELLSRMLDSEPENRPSAAEVFCFLRGIPYLPNPESSDNSYLEAKEAMREGTPEKADQEPVPEGLDESSENRFYFPGDL